MAHHGWIPVLDPRAVTPSGLKSPFGRLFEAADHQYSSHAVALLAGAAGPIETGGKADAAGPLPAKPGNPVGFTFLGQFIDHDLTEFRVIGEDFRLIAVNPTIGQRQRVLEDGDPTCTNGRLAKLDLDCVYGLLGVAQPDLYSDDGLFLLGAGDKDILRGPAYRNGRLIADPRNDENKLIAQIHLLFQRLHNKVHQAKPVALGDKGPGGNVFADTKLQIQNAFRRIVLHDYLPRIVQKVHLDAVLAKLAAKETFYQAMNKRARKAFAKLVSISEEEETSLVAMPVEFAHAVFRLGHSQLRSRYRVNAANEFPLFDPQRDLRGDEPITADFQVQWDLFFDKSGGPPADHGQPIDGNVVGPVFRLPPPAITEPPVSLAERNIRRGVDFGLPTGQEVASYLTEVYGAIPGTPASGLFPDVDFVARYKEVLKVDPTLAWATPLWYFILREAGLYRGGPQLGAVGGLIVAETILGSLDACAPGFDLQAEVTAAPGPAGSVEGIRSMSHLLEFIGEF